MQPIDVEQDSCQPQSVADGARYGTRQTVVGYMQNLQLGGCAEHVRDGAREA